MARSALTTRDLAALPAALDLVTACRALGISRSKGYGLLRAGEFPLPALRIGGQWRFRASDLCALLQGAEVRESA